MAKQIIISSPYGEGTRADVIVSEEEFEQILELLQKWGCGFRHIEATDLNKSDD